MQCCGSGMFIPDPDFLPSWMLGLRSRIKKEGEILSFLEPDISQNLKLFIFVKVPKEFEPIDKINKYFEPQKLLLSSQQYGFEIRVWNPGSWKNSSRIQGPKKHRIPHPHCFFYVCFECTKIPPINFCQTKNYSAVFITHQVWIWTGLKGMCDHWQLKPAKS